MAVAENMICAAADSCRTSQWMKKIIPRFRNLFAVCLYACFKQAFQQIHNCNFKQAV